MRDDYMDTMHTYEVEMRSGSGMWAHYSGTVTVVASNDLEAEERARDKLKRGAFYDRPRDSWIVDGVRRLDANT